jgi:hypothetical protein
MHTFASPRRGYCASCDGVITDRPVYRMDEAYCCLGCAQNGPCICTYEEDLADDGVNNLGLPFAMEPVVAGEPSGAADRVGQEVPVR